VPINKIENVARPIAHAAADLDVGAASAAFALSLNRALGTLSDSRVLILLD